MNFLIKIVIVFGALLFAGQASATTISATMTADNSYTVYISTNDSVAGTAFGSNGSWPTVSTHSTTLTNGVTNYLHVFAQDAGSPEMFIGDFSLSDSNFSFVNATQSLLTNTTDWSGNATGFGSPYTALSDLGPDGTSPWGFMSGINDSARYIWVANNASTCGISGNDCSYFSTAIRWIGGQPPPNGVPEPTIFMLLGIGLAGLGLTRRKKA